jgi:hypothetical protein
MTLLEHILDEALKSRDSSGRKTKKRDIDLDLIMFKIWDMHTEGMSCWEITKRLYPHIQDKSPYDWDVNYSEEAGSHLRRVERALRKAFHLISSIKPQ